VSIVRKTIAFMLALLGLFDSIYLLWMYLSPSIPMVCLGGGCDAVRASEYAHLFGIPTPVYGVIMYSVLAALMFIETANANAGWSRRAVLAVSAAGVEADVTAACWARTGCSAANRKTSRIRLAQHLGLARASTSLQ